MNEVPKFRLPLGALHLGELLQLYDVVLEIPHRLRDELRGLRHAAQLAQRTHFVREI